MAVPLPLSLCKNTNVSIRKNTHRQHNIVPAYKRNPIIHTYDKCFPNQKVFGKRIADAFLSNTSLVNQLAIAPTSLAKRDPWLASFMKFFKTSYYGFQKNMFSYFPDILPSNGSHKPENVSLLGCIRRIPQKSSTYFLKF